MFIGSSCVPGRVRIRKHGFYVKMTPTERSQQVVPGMKFRTMCPVVVTCRYRGRQETVTVPANHIFHGDNFKELLKLETTGIAWLVQDWLYGTHAFDRRPDGKTTTIPSRWTVDELMYRILALEKHTSYAEMLRSGDQFFAQVLETHWNKAILNVRYTR